jgi:hypothetical protein
VPQDFKVVKQSAVQGNTVVWYRPRRHILAIKGKKMNYDRKNEQSKIKGRMA